MIRVNSFSPSLEILELSRVLHRRFEAVKDDEEVSANAKDANVGVGLVEIAFHEVGHIMQIKDRRIQDEILGGSLVGAFAVGEAIEENNVASNRHEMVATAVSIEMARLYMEGVDLLVFKTIAEGNTVGNLRSNTLDPPSVKALVREYGEQKVNKERARKGAKYIDRFVRMYRNQ